MERLLVQLCESSYGWPMMNYSEAAVGLVFFLAWLVVYHDEPHLHRRVSEKEIKAILSDKSVEHLEKSHKIPYMVRFLQETKCLENHEKQGDSGCVAERLRRDRFGHFHVAIRVRLLLPAGPCRPTYFKHILHYDIARTGWIAALQNFSFIPCRVLFGILADRVQ